MRADKLTSPNSSPSSLPNSQAHVAHQLGCFLDGLAVLLFAIALLRAAAVTVLKNSWICFGLFSGTPESNSQVLLVTNAHVTL